MIDPTESHSPHDQAQTLSLFNVSFRNEPGGFYLSFRRYTFSLYMLQVEAKDPETMAMEFWCSLSSVWLIARFIY